MACKKGTDKNELTCWKLEVVSIENKLRATGGGFTCVLGAKY